MRRLIVAAILIAGCASTQQSAPTTAPTAAAPDPQIAALQASMTELLERLDVMNDRITRLEKANEEAKPTLPAAETQPARPSPPASRHPLPTGEGIMTGYRNALTAYGSKDWARARAGFQQVFDADPSGELADNALFWIGGTYFATANYNEAIRFYKRVVDEYSDQNKAPDAMYMLALTYEKTGDLALARTTLQQLIEKYPYSSEASSAKSELNRIKY